MDNAHDIIRSLRCIPLRWCRNSAIFLLYIVDTLHRLLFSPVQYTPDQEKVNNIK